MRRKSEERHGSTAKKFLTSNATHASSSPLYRQDCPSKPDSNRANSRDTSQGPLLRRLTARVSQRAPIVDTSRLVSSVLLTNLLTKLKLQTKLLRVPRVDTNWRVERLWKDNVSAVASEVFVV